MFAPRVCCDGRKKKKKKDRFWRKKRVGVGGKWSRLETSADVDQWWGVGLGHLLTKPRCGLAEF